MKKENQNKIKLGEPEIKTVCSICKTVSPLCEWCGEPLKYYTDYHRKFCIQYKNKILHFDNKICLLNYLDSRGSALFDDLLLLISKDDKK